MLTNIKQTILLYGENLGLKKEFIDKIKSINYEEDFTFSQEELIKNKEIIIKQIVNISLFQKNKIFLINQVNDKLFDIVKEILELIDTQKLYLFGDILEKNQNSEIYLRNQKS